jgi:hypothetical protein
MKNLKYSLFVGVLLLAACGPSAEEQAKEQQRIADSAAAAATAEAEARMQDSLVQVEKMKADSLAAVEMKIQDSLRIVAQLDSINKAKTKKSKAPVKKLIDQGEAPKVAKPAQGRGG